MSDSKSALSIYCQKFLKSLPKYETKQCISSSRKSTILFESTLFLPGVLQFKSEGTHGSKKSAEQNVAGQAMKFFTEQTKEKLSQIPPQKMDQTKQEESETQKTACVAGHLGSQMTPDSSSAPSTPQSSKPLQPSIPYPGVSIAFSKNLLNEHAQKHHLTLPQYQSFSQKGSFFSIVTFNGVKYQSRGFQKTKKDAEKSAALEALLALEKNSSCSLPTVPSSSQALTPNSMTSPSTSVVTPLSKATPQLSYKSVLQEYMQQRRLSQTPTYLTTTFPGTNLFTSKVIFGDQTAETKQGCNTKKEAEQLAAREALVTLGVEDPDELAARQKGKGRVMANLIKFKPLFDEIRQIRKRPRLDEQGPETKKLKLENKAVENEVGQINFLSVGEIWRERNNIALVGNQDTSFVLHCTRLANTLCVLNTRTMEHHQLMPGHRIIGLDADIVQDHGHLVLQAERCADIEVPAQPDPVLISCGVVTLNQDSQNRDNVEVLLKRYNVSQAFVHIKPDMAQYFRRALSGNPVPLPLKRITENINQWRIDEVVAMAIMTTQSLKQIFSGLYIEKPNECAARELKEETGLILYPHELEKAPFVDLLQTENLNPHCGDVARYFIHKYKDNGNTSIPRLSMNDDYRNLKKHQPKIKLKPVSLSQLLENDGQASPKVKSSKTPENEPTFFVLDDGSGKEVDKMTKNVDDLVDNKDDEMLEKPNKALVENKESENSDIKMEPVSLSDLLADTDPDLVSKNSKPSEETFFVVDDVCSSPSDTKTVSKTTPLNTALPSDHKVDFIQEKNPEATNETPETRGKKRKRSTSDEDNEKPSTSPSYQSPTVKGGEHEECAWFPLEQALQVSPTFATIYENQIFIDFLKSIKDPLNK